MSELSASELERLYVEENMTQREIAEKFGVSQPLISRKMKAWGIESRFSGWWSDREEEILKEKYNRASKEEILSSLPNRSWASIKLKAMNLGLSTPWVEHRRSEEVIERLRKNAKKNEIDIKFNKVADVSYILGVIDGDGFHDKKGTVGLEVKSSDFADKFASKLSSIGLNPGRGQRRGKETVWASSMKLIEWVTGFDYDSKFEWLRKEGDCWKYLEGAYDSDGNLSNPGPRICSYDKNEKVFLARIIRSLDMEARIHSNNVYITAEYKAKFFENIEPVYEKRRP